MEVRQGKCLCGYGPEHVVEENGKQIIERCPLYIQIRGTNPQTGEPLDQWCCSIAAIPMLMIELGKEVREGAAATESFRNLIDQQLRQAQRFRQVKAARPMKTIEHEPSDDAEST